MLLNSSVDLQVTMKGDLSGDYNILENNIFSATKKRELPEYHRVALFCSADLCKI
jgi:hypothetical protein